MASVSHIASHEGTVTYQVVTSTRSSIMSAMEHVRANIKDCGHLVGASVVQDKAYPGWQPDPHSRVLEVRIPYPTHVISGSCSMYLCMA